MRNNVARNIHNKEADRIIAVISREGCFETHRSI